MSKFNSVWTITNIILILVTSHEAAKILIVIPTPSISHQVAFRPLVNELVKRGHEVVKLTTDPEFPKGQTPENLTEIDLHDLSYSIWKDFVKIGDKGDRRAAYKQWHAMAIAMTEVFVHQAQTNEVKEEIFLKNNTFDLIMLEAWVKQPLAYSHIVKAPVILVSSLGAFFYNLNTIGAVYHPLLYPQPTQQNIHDLTFWQKIENLHDAYKLSLLYDDLEKRDNEALRKVFGSDMPSLSELQNNVDMMFLNVHPIWDGNRPVPPGVVYMGGIHQISQKELPKDLQAYLDLSSKGVIYVSFGTNVDPTLLPAEKIQALVDAFSQLPYNVLWKWNGDILPGKTDNIKIMKWLPQSDLLKHSNIKLFITQGGLQSTDEAITAGVPLIGIPMLADQWYNVERYVQLKIGLKIELSDVTVDLVKAAVTTIIKDKSYRENVIKLRTIMSDQPTSPLERAVWWTEHVLRHAGARHLRAPAANMSWPRYYDLPLALTLLAALILGIVILTSAMYFLIKFLLRLVTYNTKVKRS